MSWLEAANMLACSYSSDKETMYRLVQDPRHAVYQELKVLWAVQSTKEMSEEVLRCGSAASFRYGVQYQY